MQRQLESEGRLVAPAGVVRDLLLTDAGGLLATGRGAGGARRFPVELRVEAHGGTTTVQEVMLELGLPEPSRTGAFPLSWAPAGHTRLLPSFRGSLALVPDGEGTLVRISGSYRPPLGRLGDGLIGHSVARRSLDSLVTLLSARLSEEAKRHSESVGRRPARHPEGPLDRQPAETWLG